jgi:hypothetical protein
MGTPVIGSVRRGFAFHRKILKAIREERNFPVAVQEFSPVDPVHQANLQHVKIILFPGSAEAAVPEIFKG